MDRLKALQKILLFFILLALQSPGYGEELSLPEVVNQLEATLEWEPLSNLGRITKGERWVTFKIDSPYLMLSNDQIITTKPVLREKNGAISISREALTGITDYLSVENYTLSAPKIAVILIDPGHGGKDPGAVGKYTAARTTHGIKEKDVVLKVSHLLGELLRKQYPDKKVLLTRETDTYLSLEERTEKANAVKLEKTDAIIFVSVHVNASFSAAAKGFEVWYLPPQTKRNLIGTEDMEVQDQDIIPILNTMLDAEYTTESILLAKSILNGMHEKLNPLSPNRGLKAEKWFVVHKSKMPSVLIELGFITNPEEALRLSTDTYLQTLALGIYNGLINFIRNFESSKAFVE